MSGAVGSGRLSFINGRNILRSEVMIKLGVIGYGYWGPNIVRNFWGTKTAKSWPCAIRTLQHWLGC